MHLPPQVRYPRPFRPAGGQSALRSANRRPSYRDQAIKFAPRPLVPARYFALGTGRRPARGNAPPAAARTCPQAGGRAEHKHFLKFPFSYRGIAGLAPSPRRQLGTHRLRSNRKRKASSNSEAIGQQKSPARSGADLSASREDTAARRRCETQKRKLPQNEKRPTLLLCPTAQIRR